MGGLTMKLYIKEFYKPEPKIADYTSHFGNPYNISHVSGHRYREYEKFLMLEERLRLLEARRILLGE